MGGGKGVKTSSRLPSSSATVMAWVRYLIGNIDYFFFLCLTLVTKRITPFFKYKLLVIFHHDVKFLQLYISYLRLAELGQLSGVAAILRFPMPDIADDEGSADSEED